MTYCCFEFSCGAEVGQTSAVYQAETCHPNDGIRLWPVSSEVPKEGVTWVVEAKTVRDSGRQLLSHERHPLHTANGAPWRHQSDYTAYWLSSDSNYGRWNPPLRLATTPCWAVDATAASLIGSELRAVLPPLRLG